MDEISKLEKCMQDLHLTNPRDDKKRIEDTKGGLLEDSYRWILENSDFQGSVTTSRADCYGLRATLVRARHTALRHYQRAGKVNV